MDGVFRVLGSLWDTFWSWPIENILLGVFVIVILMFILDRD